MAATKEVPDWLRLQNKIFTRWVNQKVSKRNVTVKDAVSEFSDGILLITLVEELSEKKYEGKLTKDPKVRAQKLDNVSNALQFVWSCGVDMKLKPSADNLVDGDERSVLSLIWAIMLKFLKFGDDDEEQQLNAKDALLLWCQNKTQGYDIKVENFTRSFQDGLALAAIIHKHRPKLLDYHSLDKSDKKVTLKKVMDAAERYFGLEQYLSVDDIPKLDENSMVVYVSEYFYGIAEQRKLDLAAKRISKVIKLTKENDAMKKEYNERVAKLKEHITKVEKILEDRTIDNTMAGAKRRLEEFYEYKTKDKNVILGTQLDLVALYNNLAMILAHNKRPTFNPPAGLTLKDIEASVKHLEECESERKVALHAELNRQIKLVALDEQHKNRFANLKGWVAEKTTYLQRKEKIESVSAAQLHLRLLDAYEKENAAVSSGSVSQLHKLGAELASEKYERSAEVAARETELKADFVKLAELSKAKRPVLDDDLAREQFRERVGLLVKEHIDSHQKILNWVAEKETYLKVKEAVDSISDARTHLSLLESYEKEKVSLHNNNVTSLKQLGAGIKAEKYETKYSSWVFEKPQEIDAREKSIEDSWATLVQLSSAKKKVLEADLATELEKERLRLDFAHLASEFQRWIKEKSEDVAVSHFGFNIEEVEAFQHTLNSSNSAIENEASSRKSEYTAVDSQLKQLGVKHNVYTISTLDSLAKAKELLDSAVKDRNEAFAKELARQRANDALAKEFANVAEPFVQWTVDEKDKITNSTSELEEQLKYVVTRIEHQAKDGAKLAEIKKLDAQIEAAGITNNRHTKLTAKDVEVIWEQYTIFLEKKKKMLEGEIERSKLQGITPEQFAEIETTFHQFDANKNGLIERNELKACLYSLGEEKSKSELEEILTKYGDGKKITFGPFREFMISILGVSDTKEDIVKSFVLINKGSEVALVDRMELVMEDGDLQYVTATASKKGSGYDYIAWTEDVFSR